MTERSTIASRAEAEIENGIEEESEELKGFDIPENESESIFDKGLNALITEKDLDMKSDLNSKMVVALSRAEVLAEEINIPLLKRITTHIMRKRLSKDRQSRKEVIGLTRSYRDETLGYGYGYGGGGDSMWSNLLGKT